MVKKEIHTPDNDKDTRNRILDTATRLFALKSFKTVTLREIAIEVGIKVPSIYYYYDNKETLIEDALSRFNEIYQEHRKWLSDMNDKAESLEEVIDNLFNKEFMDQLSPIARFGMSMVLKEQHNNESAYNYAVKNFYDDGISNVQAGFDKLIKKKLIPPSDTKTLATLFMFCIISGNELHMHEFTETDTPPIDFAEVYKGLRRLIISALKHGILVTT